jgi:hypothetical protein
LAQSPSIDNVNDNDNNNNNDLTEKEAKEGIDVEVLGFSAADEHQEIVKNNLMKNFPLIQMNIYE